MLSILIPIYNYTVTTLVEELSGQCKALGIAYEILCYDDGSSRSFLESNQSLDQIYNVCYKKLEVNHGRAKIRNLLARDAQNEYLLFLDCDSGVPSGDFIQKYIDQKDKADVINGGRIYSKDRPEEKHLLHWKYGHERESKSAQFRSDFPLKYFHSNNFLIKNSVMRSYPFDESIEGYGYEDLKFAHKLSQSKVHILHISNPVVHLDLQESEVFLEKTKQAIDNLIHLESRDDYLGTSLQELAIKIKRFGLSGLYTKMYRSNAVLKNLSSPTPSIKLLNLYKLNYYLNKKKP